MPVEDRAAYDIFTGRPLDSKARAHSEGNFELLGPLLLCFKRFRLLSEVSTYATVAPNLHT